MKKNKSVILKKIKKYIHQIDENADIILFGSRARNEERDDSDWDLLILTNKPVSLNVEQKFRHKLFDLELMFDISLSTFVYNKAEWNEKYRITPLYKNVKNEGIIL